MIDLAWHPADAVALGDHLASADLPAQTTRLCPTCGSGDHGRPHASGVHVSLSRSGPHQLTALCAESPVGVDVESVADVGRHWAPGLVLAPGEAAPTPEDRARAWTRKEAVLKALGHGWAIAMTDVRLAEHRWRDVSAPEGYVAAVAWLESDQLESDQLDPDRPDRDVSEG